MCPEKLLLDGMCGKLARWLRLLGFDAEYHKDADDEVLLSEAERTGRVIVTRDQGLYSKAVKKGLKCVLLTSTDHVESMRKVLRELNAKIVLPLRETRCPLCNNPLKEVSPDSVVSLLPLKDLAERYDKFWLCEKCKKAYWIGSHWRNIKKTLREVEGCAEED
jgi:uncharacterized protein with PIN domain